MNTMTVYEAELCTAEVLRFADDIRRIPLGSMVEIQVLTRTKIGIGFTHILGKTLWDDSMARGLLHDYGWAGKFFEHKPVFPTPNVVQK